MKFIMFCIIVGLCWGGYYWLFTEDDEPVNPDTKNEIVQVDPVEVTREVNSPETKPSKTPLKKGKYKQDMEQENWEKALVAIPQDPTNIGAMHDRLLCLVNLDRKEEAVSVLKVVLNKGKGRPAAVLAAVTAVKYDLLPLLELRKLLSQTAHGAGQLNSKQADHFVAAVEKINQNMPDSTKGLFQHEKYEVRPNDCLWNICKKFRKKNSGLESGLIQKLNNLKGDMIHPGQSLIIPKDKISIKVWKKNWLLTLYLGDMLLGAYKVGLGKNQSTPAGDFVITTKQEKPDWISPNLGRVPYGDPRNILGTRWLGFENTPNVRGIGIHGTTEPDSIGKNMSAGCIRMKNKHVEELFGLVGRGARVKIL